MREHGQTVKVTQETQLAAESDDSVDESVGEQDSQIFVSPTEMENFVLKVCTRLQFQSYRKEASCSI